MIGRIRFAGLSLALLALVVTACEKDPTSSHEPEVTNVRDNFHFHLSDVSNHDSSLTYYWRTGGTSANINQNSSIEGGSASLRIVGPDSIETYRTDFTQNGDFRSGSSDSGVWKISLVLVDFSGMIDFRVQRR